MTLIPQWFKQLFIHHASSERCTIVEKPSTMSDVDAMFCEEKQKDNRTCRNENLLDVKTTRNDTIVIDKFQACFIDCKCQCEARKRIPQIKSTKCNDFKSQLFDELFQQIHGSSYEISCCCDCGQKGMRKLKFHYTTGSDKMKA